MATSGSFSTSLGASFDLVIRWNLVSQSIEECSSQVRIRWSIYKKRSNTTTWNMSATGTAKANGTTYANGVKGWWDMRDYNVGDYQNYCDKTITVAHNQTTGACSFNVSGSFNPGNVNGATSGSLSKTITLPELPRMTTPVLSAASAVMGQQITVDLTGAASSAFTHDLSYTLPDGTGKVFAAKKGAEKVALTVPDFAQQLPAAETGVLTVTCTTYDGSGALIGTKTATMTASVPSNVLPTITKVAVTETVAGLAQKYGGFVQSKSRPRVDITAAGAKGSTITSLAATLDGNSYTGASWTAAVLSGSGTLPLRVTVKDSRGRTATSNSTITVMAYAVPTITAFSAVRSTAAGAASDNGGYALLKYAYAVPSLNGGNTAAMTIAAKRSTASAYDVTLLTGTALSANTSAVSKQAVSSDYRWDIQMTVRDSFGAVTTATVQLPSAEVVMDFKADGTGMGVGKTSEQAGLDIDWPVTMRKSLKAMAGVEGKASSATVADRVKASLTFTGGVTGAWDGTAAKTVAIPQWKRIWQNANVEATFAAQTINVGAFTDAKFILLTFSNGVTKNTTVHYNCSYTLTTEVSTPWYCAVSQNAGDYLFGRMVTVNASSGTIQFGDCQGHLKDNGYFIPRSVYVFT